jgi:hypothetical protein
MFWPFYRCRRAIPGGGNDLEIEECTARTLDHDSASAPKEAPK